MVDRSLSAVIILAITGWQIIPGLVYADNAKPSVQTGPAIEEVVVTGSRIRRVDFTSISPLVTIDHSDLKLSGATNLEDALNALPGVIPDLDRTSNNPQTGPEEGFNVARINLRGLGAKRTLVLLNGRRLAPSGISGAIDINSIPAAFITRVEVVSGGASAVYGSDAIAGAVNFILNDDFEGFNIDAQIDVTQAGDGRVYDVNLGYGQPFNHGRGHLTLSGGFQKRDPIFWDDRDFSAVPLFEDPDAGKIVQGGSNTTPAGVIVFPPAIIDGEFTDVTFNTDGTPRAFIDPDDLYNYAPDNYLQTPLTRWNANAFAGYELLPSVNAFIEFMFTRNDVKSYNAPVPAFGFFAVNTDNPLLTPETRSLFETFYDPDGDGIAEAFMLRRMSEIGPRLIDYTQDSIRVLGGIEGKFFDNWQGQVYYSYSEVSGAEANYNDASQSRLQQGLLVDPATGLCFDLTGGCVPVNAFGAGNLSQEGAAFVRIDPLLNTDKVREQVVQATVTGDLVSLPAGPLGIAVGGEWRKLRSDFVPDPALFTGDSLGYNPEQPAGGKIKVMEVFGEARMPLLDDNSFTGQLNLEAGFRVSDYSLSGVTTAWKAGGDWSPLPVLRIRGMFQRAVRTANIQELFQEPSVEFGFGGQEFYDRCSASKDPIGNGLTDVCIAQGLVPNQIGVFEAADSPITLFNGGNPDLNPEIADSVTVGMVLQPEQFPGFSAALDYYAIGIDNAIVNLGNAALHACFLLKDPNAEVCRLSRRGPDGNVNEIDFVARNISVLRTAGLDLQLRYQFDAPALDFFNHGASINIHFLGTHTMEYGVSAETGLPLIDCTGYFGYFCANTSFGTIPEFRTTTRFTYSSGPATVSLRWRWLDGIRNSIILEDKFYNLSPNDSLVIPSVSDQHYLDLFFNLKINMGMSMNAGITNLLDNDPPLLGSQSNGANTDPSTYDVIGRRFYIGLSLEF